MRLSLACAVLILAPLASATSAALAAEPRVERIDIVDAGTYSITPGEETADPNTPTGKITAVDKVENIDPSTTVKGAIGTEFGFRYRVVGEPADAEVTLDMVYTYPPPGLADPEETAPIPETRFARQKKIGETVYLGYGFENPWEIVPGTWTFTISYQGRKLAEKSFTVVK